MRFRLATPLFYRYLYDMFVVCAIFLVTAAAGLIAGAGIRTFLAAAVSAGLATWLVRAPCRSSLHLFANLDPHEPDSTILVDALREALRLIRSTRNPVLLRISAFARKDRSPFRFGLNRDGDLEVCCEGKRARALRQPGVWIADHPVPLTLPQDRCVTLRLTPAAAGRVRASLSPARELRGGLWLAVALLVIAACALDVSWLLAAALGFAFQARLLEHDSHRTNGQP